MAAQLPDKIFLEGDIKALYSNPLEQYWVNKKKRRQPFCSTEECRRGYIATWEVANNQLFLTGIEGQIQKSMALFGPKIAPYSLKKLFPRSRNNKVKADWYSGRLRIPLGNMTRFEDHEYDSRFERDIIITVEQGNVVRMATLDNTDHSLIIKETPSLV
jgi:hypothetical protein